ncbi:MAG: ATP-binding protein, partial [Verrucomicrobiales bacterium]
EVGDIIFTEEDRANGAPEMEAETALREGHAKDERWHVRKNGDRFWASGVLMAMHGANGRTIGFVKILRDQTEAKRNEEALAASRLQLEIALEDAQRARDEAEAANKTKDHFLATLSHELRTPLTPVMMVAETLLRRTDLPPRALEGLEMIRHNIEVETSLVADLLDLTRISRGKFEFRIKPISLHQVLEHAIYVSRPDIESKGQRLSIHLQAEHDDMMGDAERLQQVFWNILKNASKFTPEGGSIQIVSSMDEEKFVVNFTDNGCGIPNAALPHIFEAFRQADESITREFGGLGLGLAIAKAIIEGHNGSIAAASEGEGKGTTITVILPRTSSVTIETST